MTLEDFQKAEAVSCWLKKLGYRSIPVLVEIDRQQFLGAAYERVAEFTSGMDGVVRGARSVGDQDIYECLYLLGRRPKLCCQTKRGPGGMSEQKNVLRFPEDDRDWYVSCYMEDVQQAEYHPFGENFQLNAWDHEFTRSRIDEYDAQPRHRFSGIIKEILDGGQLRDYRPGPARRVYRGQPENRPVSGTPAPAQSSRST